jgi:hypothetical protein
MSAFDPKRISARCSKVVNFEQTRMPVRLNLQTLGAFPPPSVERPKTPTAVGWCLPSVMYA